jgi:hypothetical protein
MTKRLLSDSEKMKDERFPAVCKVFPEFDCYDDGSVEINQEKVPPGFKYIMEKNQKAIERIKEIGLGDYLKEIHQK